MPLKDWRVLELARLDEPGAREFRVGEGDWPFRGVVVRWEGQVHAYANSCAHLGHPLNIAPDKFFTADKQLLICASHGALFEPDTGICIGGPCTGARLTRLRCWVANGWVHVSAPGSLRAEPGVDPG